MEDGTKRLLFVSGIIGVTFFVGYLGSLVEARILTTDEHWKDNFWSRFQVMFVFAVLIERATEVYLQISNSNGPDRFGTSLDGNVRDDGNASAAVNAGYVSFFFALVVALVGVRLIETMGSLQTAGHPFVLMQVIGFFEQQATSSNNATFTVAADAIKDVLKTLGAAPGETQANIALWAWFSIDVIISAGLMAGGATLFHEVAEALRGGLGRLGDNMALSAQERSAMMARRNAGSPAYLIAISRNSLSSGALSVAHDSTSIDATVTCDPNLPVVEGIYNDCSKTHLEMKVDEAGTLKPVDVIWIPSASKDERIGIRAGMNAKDANGSFLMPEKEFKQLYTALQPLDGRNIQVVLKDI